MGTNYYVHMAVCAHCGRGDRELHIGKSSMGWVFGLHIIPEKGINGLDDWKKFWKNKTIKNEYGDFITQEEMLDIITNRKGLPKEKKPYVYPDWKDFHEKNGSEFGPNNLLRSKVGHHCVGHGEGTWELIQGEFS